MRSLRSECPSRLPLKSLAVRAAHWRCLFAFAFLLMLASAMPAPAQQGQARPDSLPIRPDYKNLDELLAALPRANRPEFTEVDALWLGSQPLACVDRLQPRTTGRGGAAVTPPPAPAASDSSGRGQGAAAAAGRGAPVGGGSGGANYFWVASYRLIDNHNRTRAFWGCSDWHSAASSMWVTVRLLKDYPRFGLMELSREKLNDHLGKSNLDGELDFFQNKAGAFERPYGYAWLLKLQSDLRAAPDSQARRWAANVAPLANWMADSLATHFSALTSPVRAATLNNTALSLQLALDYATASADPALRRALIAAARRFYLTDRNCNTLAEGAAAGRGGRGGPGRAGGAADSAAARAARAGGAADSAAARGGRAGEAPGAGRGGGGGGATDLLSPCLSEGALMARVLEPAAFVTWLNGFLPPLQSGRFAPLTEAYGAGATGAERTRFSALAFQRALAMERIARALPPADPRVAVWRRLSALHAERGFELLRQDTSAGSHWVPAFALLYLTSRN